MARAGEIRSIQEVQPRRKPPNMRGRGYGGIGLREHLADMLEHPERFAGDTDIAITLPAQEYLRLVRDARLSGRETLNDFIRDAIRMRLLQQEAADGR